MADSLKILIVDDEAELRRSLRAFFESHGAQVTECDNGLKAVEAVREHEFDLVAMDVRMPEMDGMTALKEIKSISPSTQVVIVTAHGNIRDAKTAILEGAFDYLEKPLNHEHVAKLVDNIQQSRKLVEQVGFSAPILKLTTGQIFVGQSGQMQKVFALINRLTEVNTSVLIRGENGTGKELVARAIHFNSPRKDKPFVAVNCAAIPENLIESELFGHEKGAFTGADQRKIGKFQYATGGTLFLDEIGDISGAVQVKLLRALQEKVYTPVGSNREFKADVRILAASNRPLEEMIAKGKFREDLFYRLNVMPITLPPLRERKSDIDFLVKHFIHKFNESHGRHVSGVSDPAMMALRNHQWPGNIRELENAIEYAFILTTGDSIEVAALPQSVTGLDVGTHGSPTPSSGTPLSDYQASKETFERDFIIQALRSNNGRINQTADKANIPKNTLLRKIKKYGITPKDYGGNDTDSDDDQ